MFESSTLQALFRFSICVRKMYSLGDSHRDTGRRVILRELECDEGFARAGGVDDGGFAARGEHGADFFVCSLVVLE